MQPVSMPRAKSLRSAAPAITVSVVIVVGIVAAGLRWWPRAPRHVSAPAPETVGSPPVSPTPADKRPLAERFASLKVVSVEETPADEDGDGKFDVLTFTVALNEKIPGETPATLRQNYYVATFISRCPAGFGTVNFPDHTPPRVPIGGPPEATDDLQRLILKVSGVRIFAGKIDGPFCLGPVTIGRNYRVLPPDEIRLAIHRAYRYEEFDDGRPAGPWIGGQAPTAIPRAELYEFHEPRNELHGTFNINANFPHDLYHDSIAGLLAAERLRWCVGVLEGPCETSRYDEAVIPSAMFHTPLYRLKFRHGGTSTELLKYYDMMVAETGDWVGERPHTIVLNSDKVPSHFRLFSARQRFRIGPDIIVKDVGLWVGDDWLEFIFFDNIR